MPHISEYQVPLPMEVPEYKVAQLYAVAKASQQETQGDEGVEIVKNEPYTDETGSGQYTYKIYHLGSKVPSWLAKLMPADMKQVHEEAWNAYPNCKTVITSPFLGNKFELKIESKHAAYDPKAGYVENIHNLSPADVKIRKVERIDIAHDKLETAIPEDPTTFKSEKTGRGPLAEKGWEKNVKPCMIAYKLVTTKANYPLVGGKIEKWIQGFEKNLFTTFHRKLFCWTDEWYGLTIEDIRLMEEETKKRLQVKIDEAKAAKAEKEGKGGKKKGDDKSAASSSVDVEHDEDIVNAAKQIALEDESSPQPSHES